MEIQKWLCRRCPWAAVAADKIFCLYPRCVYELARGEYRDRLTGKVVTYEQEAEDD